MERVWFFVAAPVARYVEPVKPMRNGSIIIGIIIRRKKKRAESSSDKRQENIISMTGEQKDRGNEKHLMKNPTF